MKLTIPDKSLLSKTGGVDYFDWNYKFPIKYIQKYRFKKIVGFLVMYNIPFCLKQEQEAVYFYLGYQSIVPKIYACDIHSNFGNIHILCKQFEITNYDLSTQSIEKQILRMNPSMTL